MAICISLVVSGVLYPQARGAHSDDTNLVQKCEGHAQYRQGHDDQVRLHQQSPGPGRRQFVAEYVAGLILGSMIRDTFRTGS